MTALGMYQGADVMAVVPAIGFAVVVVTLAVLALLVVIGGNRRGPLQ